METKALIRKHALAQRDLLSIQERKAKSAQIMQSVSACREYQSAKSLLVYASYRSEVETELLIQKALEDGKKVYCPKVEGKEMEFYRINALEELKEGYKGIREPEAVMEQRFCEEEAKSLMLMPGSAFDVQKNRIGYGGGFYDKYLEKHPKLATIAVCFQCQIQKNIPADPYDKKPDVVLTECNRY